MQINRKKCDFIKENVEFIGHSVSAEGLKPLQSKLDEIVTFRTPYNVEQLRTFLGLAAYYRKFVKDFAIIAQPLYGLWWKLKNYGKRDVSNSCIIAIFVEIFHDHPLNLCFQKNMCFLPVTKTIDFSRTECNVNEVS